MRIEKVNENQIRCVLTREDLADRQIKLSELAYGSEKAKSLFKEMIQQANFEVGFDVDGFPLMVEAIPVSAESIILIITKVEFPDELDTRFSKFTEPDEYYDTYDASLVPEDKVYATDIIEFYNKIRKEVKIPNPEEPEKESPKVEEAPVIPADLTKMFEFRSLDRIERLAHVLEGFYEGENTLYKNDKRNSFFLLIHKSDHSPEDFNKVCNIISEYAAQRKFGPAVGAHFEEHCKKIISQNALQVLASL